ncbi:MAG: lytic transglycosylase domain-containing protein [Planctomycetota bacterium]
MYSLFAPTRAELRRRRTRRWLRIGQVAGLLALVGLLGATLFRAESRLVVRAARDLFAERRVLEQRGPLEAAAAESGVDIYLLAGLMISESSGRPGAVSNKGALGLFQLMPATAQWRAERMGLPAPTPAELLEDAELNARLGANNLAWLLRRYDEDVERALVAYNAGPGRLKAFESAAGGWEQWRAERRASGESEIFAYVDRVLRYADGFRRHGLFDDESGASSDS